MSTWEIILIVISVLLAVNWVVFLRNWKVLAKEAREAAQVIAASVSPVSPGGVEITDEEKLAIAKQVSEAAGASCDMIVWAINLVLRILGKVKGKK